MLSKQAKGRIALNREKRLSFSKMNQETSGDVQVGLGVHAFAEQILGRKLHGLGLSKKSLENTEPQFSTAEIMRREAVAMGIIPEPRVFNGNPLPALDEEVQCFEGSPEFKTDLLKVLVRAGNPDMQKFIDDQVDFHAFGYIPKEGRARIRIEMFTVIGAKHATVSMPLTVADLQKRNTPITVTVKYGDVAGIFEAAVSEPTYYRWKYLVNRRDIHETDFNIDISNT